MVNKNLKQIEFFLDPKSGIPFYKQIILQIEMAIADGRLKSGDQLPTVRGLAVELSLNPNTVAKAYTELEIRGIVNTQQGSGTFISDKKIEVLEVEREKILNQITRQFISLASSYGFKIKELIYCLKELENSQNNLQEEQDENNRAD